MSVGVAFRKNRMSSKLFDLSGRTGLVTGSARGLGNALAEGLAEAGGTIVLISSLHTRNALISLIPTSLGKWSRPDHVLGDLGSASEILQWIVEAFI
jgi:gluconate 5-dehydrogenase